MHGSDGSSPPLSDTLQIQITEFRLRPLGTVTFVLSGSVKFVTDPDQASFSSPLCYRTNITKPFHLAIRENFVHLASLIKSLTLLRCGMNFIARSNVLLSFEFVKRKSALFDNMTTRY